MSQKVKQAPKTRQDLIVDQVHAQGRVTVEALAEAFDASRETIRRDLTVLAEIGKIQKIHGGAKVLRIGGEGSFQERLSRNAPAKKVIAELASTLVSSGDTLFIDTGSTTLSFAREIARVDDLTIITNSTEIAKAISAGNSTSKVFLLGGAYDGDNMETFGPLAIEQLRHFQASHAILTVGGLGAESGITDFNSEEAHLARAMIEQSKTLVVLADSTKFGEMGAFRVCALDKIDYLVSDVLPDDEFVGALKKANVNVMHGNAQIV